MSKETPLRLYTVGTLLRDTAFRQGICSISNICGGGGGGSASWGGITGTITNQTDLVTYISDQLDTVDLQSATDNGNVTSNAIQITGGGNFSGVDSLILYKGLGGGDLALLDGGNTPSIVSLRAEYLRLTYNNSQNLTMALEDDDAAGVQISTRVSGMDAMNVTDFVTFGQVQNTLLNNTVVPAALPTAEIVPNTVYTYTQMDDAANWDLPAVSGNTGSRVVIINFSTESITLHSNGGGNDIFDNGVSSSTLEILTGITKVLYNNSIAWVALT